MWSDHFKKKRTKPQATQKEHEAQQAHAIREALDPEYLASLRRMAKHTPHSRLIGLIESIEAAAAPSDTEQAAMSDRSIIHTAQKLVGILNDIARPPRFTFEKSHDGREFERYDAQDKFGNTQADKQADAMALAEKLQPYVPKPKLIGRMDGNNN